MVPVSAPAREMPKTAKMRMPNTGITRRRLRAKYVTGNQGLWTRRRARASDTTGVLLSGAGLTEDSTARAVILAEL